MYWRRSSGVLISSVVETIISFIEDRSPDRLGGNDFGSNWMVSTTISSGMDKNP
jgi:hypothetical protein